MENVARVDVEVGSETTKVAGRDADGGVQFERGPMGDRGPPATGADAETPDDDRLDTVAPGHGPVTVRDTESKDIVAVVGSVGDVRMGAERPRGVRRVDAVAEDGDPAEITLTDRAEKTAAAALGRERAPDESEREFRAAAAEAFEDDEGRSLGDVYEEYGEYATDKESVEAIAPLLVADDAVVAVTAPESVVDAENSDRETVEAAVREELAERVSEGTAAEATVLQPGDSATITPDGVTVERSAERRQVDSFRVERRNVARDDEGEAHDGGW